MLQKGSDEQMHFVSFFFFSSFILIIYIFSKQATEQTQAACLGNSPYVYNTEFLHKSLKFHGI